MGKFGVEITELAREHIKKHLKSGDKTSIKKIETILIELEVHPKSGIGQPEELKYDLTGYWSRKVNQKDRMIYSINDTTVVVEVVSAMGHYSDK